MATNETPIQMTLTPIRRTWRTTIDTPKGGPYIVTANRERLLVNNDEIISREENAGIVQRNVADVAAEQVTLAGGKVLTAAEVTEAVEKFLEKWELEDRASE